MTSSWICNWVNGKIFWNRVDSSCEECWTFLEFAPLPHMFGLFNLNAFPDLSCPPLTSFTSSFPLTTHQDDLFPFNHQKPLDPDYYRMLQKRNLGRRSVGVSIDHCAVTKNIFAILHIYVSIIWWFQPLIVFQSTVIHAWSKCWQMPGYINVCSMQIFDMLRPGRQAARQFEFINLKLCKLSEAEEATGGHGGLRSR